MLNHEQQHRELLIIDLKHNYAISGLPGAGGCAGGLQGWFHV